MLELCISIGNLVTWVKKAKPVGINSTSYTQLATEQDYSGGIVSHNRHLATVWL